jgi:PKD repeat protein
MRRFIVFLLICIGFGSAQLSAQNCQADFNFWSQNLTVQFIDSSFSSTGNHTYNWSFGDGTSDTLSGPLHTYNQAGTYFVRLEIVDSICTDTVVKQVTVSNPCVANYSYRVIDSLGTVQFTNLTTPSSGLSYQWDFGDGSPIGTSKDPVHQYANRGRYTVNLMVSGNGTTCSYIDSVTVNYCSVYFVSQSDTNGLATFNNRTLYSNLNVFWRWDFGDGDTSYAMSPTHNYTASGFYNVSLYMFDTTSYCWGTYTDSIVINISPKCAAGFLYSANQDTITFQNTSTSFTSISYDFGDGNSSNLENPTHIYGQSGTYVVCQTVTNQGHCSDVFCDTIQVVVDCASGFTYSQSGDTVQIQNTATNFNRLVYYFGDGDSSTLENPIHFYQNSGTYLIQQIIYNDSTNCSDTSSQSITITISSSCVAKYLIAIDTTVTGTLFLVNESSNVPSHQYLWDFGDGTTSTGRTPTHQYSENKAYKICLTVSDINMNCTSTYCDSVGLDSSGNILKSGGFKIKVLNGGFIGIQEQAQLDDLKIYPNPTFDFIQIDFNSFVNNMTYSIIGIDGSLKGEGVFNSIRNKVDLQQLEKGMYFLRISNGKEFITRKIIKQ